MGSHESAVPIVTLTYILTYLFIICFTAYIQQDTYSININSLQNLVYAESPLASSVSGLELLRLIIVTYINSFKARVTGDQSWEVWGTYYNYNRDRQKKKCMHCQDQNSVQIDSIESLYLIVGRLRW